MNQIFILFLLVLKICNGDKIVKRFANDQNNTIEDSFHVNVSAGYGVHSDNTTISSTVFPVYKFQERIINKENDSLVEDQIVQASQSIPEIIPSPSYQVHEKSAEVQEKNFHVGKSHRYRSTEKRYRLKSKPVDLETKETVRQPVTKLAPGTKIVEVLRVPAMYELHLQSDPQRLVSLNTALLTKLRGMMKQNQYKRPYPQQNHQPSTPKPYLQQPQSTNLNYAYANNAPHQRFGTALQNIKNKVFPSKPYQIPSSSPYQPYQIPPSPHQPRMQQSFGGHKNNYMRPQSFQNSYQIEKKPETTTVAPSSFQQSSNEIPADYYQKPQALHEVPAPVLNKQSYNKHQSFAKVQPTSVPSLVYGKPVDPPYQPTTQHPPETWTVGQNQNQNHNYYPNYQNEDVANSYYPPNDNMNYQQQQNDNLKYQPIQNDNFKYQQMQNDNLNYQQTQTENMNYQQANNDNLGYGQDNTGSYQPPYQRPNFYDPPHYQGYKNEQNYYNDAIGGYLDQNLVNVNGGVATYLNADGTMTVSNFHHQPKLYRPPMDYESMSEEMENDDDIKEDNNMEDFNKQNQDYKLQNNADLTNLLLATSRSGNEEAKKKYETLKTYPKKYPKMLFNSKTFNRRKEPTVDYIFLIKEKTFD